MNLTHIVGRTLPPEPWSEGEKIPWNEPGFSRRMLAEHLSQHHDAASRRAEKIDRHVEWIHGDLLEGNPTRILDLCCGPGLYTSRLARLGHECVGVDFSPASIGYARKQAAADEGSSCQPGRDARAYPPTGSSRHAPARRRPAGFHRTEGSPGRPARAGSVGSCEYILGDLRTAEFGSRYGLVTMIFGEFNVFRRDDALLILRKARVALEPGGLLLFEPQTYEAVKAQGEAASSWSSCDSGLFSERPHICLEEHFWHEDVWAATTRWFIIDAATGEVTRHAQTVQAYTEDSYRELLAEAGFGDVRFVPSLTGKMEDAQEGLVGVVCRRLASQ